MTQIGLPKRPSLCEPAAAPLTTPLRTIAAVVLLLGIIGGVAGWLYSGLEAATRPPESTPDRQFQQVLELGLGGDPAGSQADRTAELAALTSFTRERGYDPVLRAGMWLREDGDCSSPVRLPARFTPACQAHDLGYDLLRIAQNRGLEIPAEARERIDARFAERLLATCRPGGVEQWTEASDPPEARVVECEVAARTAAAAVRANTWRQHGGVPGAETPASVAALVGAGLSVGSAGVLVVGGVRGLRGRGRVG